MGLRGQATTVNPPSTVVTVNGRAGAVVLTPADVGITGGAATRIPVFSSASAMAGHAGFTFDPATGILATPEIDIGATPFVFKDLGGDIVQLGDAGLTFNLAGASLLIGVNGTGQATMSQLTINGTGSYAFAEIDTNTVQLGASTLRFDTNNVILYTGGNGGSIGKSDDPWNTGYFGTSVVTPLITATTGNFSGTVTAAAFVTASLQAAFVASPYGVGAGNTGEYRFLELASNGTDYVALKAPDALAAPLTYTLPAVDHVGPWMSNGSGVLSVVAGQDLTIVVPVANKTLTFTKGVLTGVV